jgi:hypothetical protein
VTNRSNSLHRSSWNDVGKPSTRDSPAASFDQARSWLTAPGDTNVGLAPGSGWIGSNSAVWSSIFHSGGPRQGEIGGASLGSPMWVGVARNVGLRERRQRCASQLRGRSHLSVAALSVPQLLQISGCRIGAGGRLRSLALFPVAGLQQPGRST